MRTAGTMHCHVESFSSIAFMTIEYSITKRMKCSSLSMKNPYLFLHSDDFLHSFEIDTKSMQVLQEIERILLSLCEMASGIYFPVRRSSMYLVHPLNIIGWHEN